MSKRKFFLGVLTVLAICFSNYLIMAHYEPDMNRMNTQETLRMSFTLRSDTENEFQLYYLTKKQAGKSDFMEEQSYKLPCAGDGSLQELSFDLPADVKLVRLDFGTEAANTVLQGISCRYKEETLEVPQSALEEFTVFHDIHRAEGQELAFRSGNGDPYLVWNVSGWISQFSSDGAGSALAAGIRILLCVILDLFILTVVIRRKRIMALPVELYHNRMLIYDLSKNDFKTKFAGSYLGTVWAFIQPVVTVLVYWFVFQKGLRAGGINTRAGVEVPYVLWLIAGLVPWFFFQDSLSSGTNALLEYSYLVKKVVFKISILPIVKIISALFVHCFFISFTLVLYCCYGYYPDLYTLQILYYSFCMFIMVLGLVYATCSVVIFFRDLSQIVNIVLQVGVWMTPIMWNIDTMELSPVLIGIFKLNPMYYIVAGYRDALIHKVWFWENPGMTVGFWLFTLAVFALGTRIFKKLKIHFADVL